MRGVEKLFRGASEKPKWAQKNQGLGSKKLPAVKGEVGRVENNPPKGQKHMQPTRWVYQFDGLLIPFGAKVSYKPISSKDDAKPHQFGNNMLPIVLRDMR